MGTFGYIGLTLFTAFMLIKFMFLQRFPFIPFFIAFIPLYFAAFSLIGMAVAQLIDGLLDSSMPWYRYLLSTSEPYTIYSLFFVPFSFFLINVKLELDSLAQSSIIVLPQLYSYIAWTIASLPFHGVFLTYFVVFGKEFCVKIIKRKWSRGMGFIVFAIFFFVVGIFSSITVLLTLYLQLQDAFPDQSSPPLPAYVALLPLWVFELVVIVTAIGIMIFGHNIACKIRFAIFCLVASMLMFSVSHILSAVFSIVDLQLGYGIDLSKSLAFIPAIPALFFLFLFFIFALK